jgi:hypothetical protein
MAYIFIAIISIYQSYALADAAYPWRDEDVRNGYTSKVNPENEDAGVILYTVEDPYKNEVKLKDKIFDEKLTKEITNRYYEKFGRTEAEIIENRTPYLNTNLTEAQSLSATEKDYQDQQKKFGNYVIRRVIEYHFDNEAKNNPDLRTVYETKQKVEKIDVSFSKNFKMRGKYNIAANTLSFTLKNPYMNAESRFEFADHEIVYSLFRDLPKKYSFISDYYVHNPTLDLILRKNVTSNLSFSFTYSPIHHYSTQDINDIRSDKTVYVNDTRFVAGTSYKF